MKKVLIVVDYQKDFVDGSLACGQDALDIEQGIYDKVQEYLKNGDQIIFTKDAHYANEYFDTHEHKLYPQHCLIDKNHLDTEGVNLYGKLLEFNEDDENERWSILYKPSNMAIGIEDYIDQHSNLDIEICGLATDLCVMNTGSEICSIARPPPSECLRRRRSAVEIDAGLVNYVLLMIEVNMIEH